jgi:glycerate dehydrogenase
MKSINISILCPRSEFTVDQLQKMAFAGQVSFVDSDKENSLPELVKLSRHADLVAFPAVKIGKHAADWLSTILEAAHEVKGIALNTVHADCIDRQFCKEKNIAVTVVPDCTMEAVAEHVLTFLLDCSKRIILNDRSTYGRRYEPQLGRELKGSALGIIGYSEVARRVAELAIAFGMIVYTCDQQGERIENANRTTIDILLTNSDLITLHLPDSEENNKFLSKERIAQMKPGAIVINLANRSLVNEWAMAKALESGQVDQYVFEADSIKHSPLKGIDRALMFKPFSRDTLQAIKRNRESWASTIASLAQGTPRNLVNL